MLVILGLFVILHIKLIGCELIILNLFALCDIIRKKERIREMFGIFKKKSNSYKDNVCEVFKNFKPQIASSLFPNGKEQAEEVVFSIAVILDLDLKRCNVEICREILDMYIGLKIRISTGTHSHDFMIATLRVNHSEYILTEEQALQIYAFSLLNKKNPEFVLKDEASFEMLFVIAKEISSMIEKTKENGEIQYKNENDLEYGLVQEKPIYTKGISGSNKYLSLLRDLNGKKLIWKRRGSIIIETINGPIDIYDSELETGDIYKTIYINMYGTQQPNKAPQGFSLESNE